MYNALGRITEYFHAGRDLDAQVDNSSGWPERLRNGDETDNGLNFGGKGPLLRVTMGSYR
jgi:hypothetical protein